MSSTQGGIVGYISCTEGGPANLTAFTTDLCSSLGYTTVTTGATMTTLAPCLTPSSFEDCSLLIVGGLCRNCNYRQDASSCRCACVEDGETYNCPAQRKGRTEWGGSFDNYICTGDGCTYFNSCVTTCCKFVGCPIGK